AGYGPIEVLHRLSLKVEPGEIVAMIGANGAGKTTTLNTICGIVKARAGEILFDVHQAVHEKYRGGVDREAQGFLPNVARVIGRAGEVPYLGRVARAVQGALIDTL